MNETHIVKRKGHKEKFDEKKVYGSVYWACKTAHMGNDECESVAGKVLTSLKKEIKDKSEIDSNKIFEFVGNELEKHHKDSAFMYKTHRDIS